MENQSHFDDYPEKGKSLIDIASRGGENIRLVVLFLVVFRSNYLLLCCCSRPQAAQRGERRDFCWRKDIHKDELLLSTFNATGNRVNGYFLFGKDFPPYFP